VIEETTSNGATFVACVRCSAGVVVIARLSGNAAVGAVVELTLERAPDGGAVVLATP
jgi:hypothetical protein